MIKQLLAVLAFTAIMATNKAGAQPTLTPFTYAVSFKIKNAGVTVDGKLQGLEASINFSPEQLATSSLTASVAVSSINTGNNKRDEHLKSSDYFDASQYPHICMKSVKLYRKENAFAGMFDVTIKDVTKEVEVPFTYTEKDGQATFEGNFTINRRDYDVGGSSLILSDEVHVHLLLNAKK